MDEKRRLGITVSVLALQPRSSSWRAVRTRSIRKTRSLATSRNSIGTICLREDCLLSTLATFQRLLHHCLEVAMQPTSQTSRISLTITGLLSWLGILPQLRISLPFEFLRPTSKQGDASCSLQPRPLHQQSLFHVSGV
jgi:hypothetical protein